MDKKNYTDSELIKLHNDGEIILLDCNLKSDDRFLFNIESHKHLYKNEAGDKYFLCIPASSDDYDFGIICDGIDELGENETLEDRSALPDSVIELMVVEELNEKELIDYLMFDALENLEIVNEITGESVPDLIIKYKKKALNQLTGKV